MSTFDEQVVRDKQKYMDELSAFRSDFMIDPILNALADTICLSASSRALNAAYGGEHHDGGASQSVREFKSFLEGVAYGKRDFLSGPYGKMIEKIKAQEDPDYKKYLELKVKFKDLE